MNFKTFSAILVILVVAGIVSATYASYRHSAFGIGDSKDIDLFAQAIGNGSARDIICILNCTGFGAMNTTWTGNQNMNGYTLSNGTVNATINLNYIYYSSHFGATDGTFGGISGGGATGTLDTTYHSFVLSTGSSTDGYVHWVYNFTNPAPGTKPYSMSVKLVNFVNGSGGTKKTTAIGFSGNLSSVDNGTMGQSAVFYQNNEGIWTTYTANVNTGWTTESPPIAVAAGNLVTVELQIGRARYYVNGILVHEDTGVYVPDSNLMKAGVGVHVTGTTTTPRQLTEDYTSYSIYY